MISNYHGHTMHCKHGIGSTREHIESAIKYGLQEVAITEHVPIKNKKFSRIDYDHFDEFITELNQLKIEYRDKIKVLSGLECEYIPEVMGDHLKLKEKYSIDFLVLGHHFSKLSQPGHYYFETSSHQMIDEYIENAIKGVESGYFKIFAHPDIIYNKFPIDEYIINQSKRLLAACAQNQIAVEINSNGLRNNKGYPSQQFWALSKDYDLTVVINADAHAPDEICDFGVQAAYKFARKLGIKVTERLDF